MKINGSKMEIPKNLKHKPIYEINEYDKVDGQHKNDTDVVGMSLGKAQWCNEENFEPSVKIWRYVKCSNDKYRWSRQSEETTLTRALDMAMFVVKIADAYAHNRHVDKNVLNSIFGELKISDTENVELLLQLKDFFDCESNMRDIKGHIDILNSAINEYYKN